ncbi:MAG: DUF1232 domain-containing protein [Bacteroidaceae bacterium]|nr:DUF1232 domain-containing protein [Bacteroidaceae bacterium]
MNRKQITSIILLIGAIVYDFIPADLIPDIPVIGWIDDFFVTSSALFNCIQQFSDDGNEILTRIMKWLKWTCLLLAVLIILVFLLLTATIISIFK